MDEYAETNGGYTEAAAYPGFRAPEAHTLPSGAVFLLRKPQIMKMMRKGQIPNPLMEIVNSVMVERDERDEVAEAALKGVTVEELREQVAEEKAAEDAEHPPVPFEEKLVTEGLRFMDVIIWATVVKPELEIAPAVEGSALTESGKLSYDALTDDDARYILHWANEETAEAGQFRGDVGRESRGGDSREVRPATV